MVQLVRRRYEVRLPREHEPVWECMLDDHEQIVGIDHIVTAWVSVRL